VWLVAVGSVVIVLHLAAVVVVALAAESGPWMTQQGLEPGRPPDFAAVLRPTVEPYLRSVKLSHSYHFSTNRPMPGVRLEIGLLDKDGNLTDTVKLPDPGANWWVRHRQLYLAGGLGGDVMLQRRERIAAPKHDTPMVEYWSAPQTQGPYPKGPWHLKLKAEHEISAPDPISGQMAGNPDFGPSPWAMLLANSYARHLSRERGAAKIAIVRYHRDAVPPTVLYVENLPDGALPLIDSHFGEFPR
jgi:hypothetical protein